MSRGRRAGALALALALAVLAGAGCRRAGGDGGGEGEGAVPAAVPRVAAPAAAPPARRAPPRPASLTRVTIKALGMYCEDSCPVRVRHALADIASVYELGFDLSKESVFISYDAALGPAKQVTRPMIAAIQQAGFDPWLARESWPDGVEVQVVAR
ncbi:MAG TPA: heavy-metal-associated domain-containing protein [Kofleriaceae bacterium]|nr:heavy-metal-associated domain-containing protein [Kofleriaceae bacterium]